MEIILAIGILGLLMGSVFTLTNSSALLSQSVVQAQTQHRHKLAFEGYLERMFLNLPHDAKITLAEGEAPLQTLIIQNPGTFFPSLENDYFASLFAASAARNSDDLINVIATWKSLENQGPEDTENSTIIDISDYQQRLTLISNLTSLQWEIYSKQDDTWQTTWSTSKGRPTHVRLSYSHSSSQEIETITFWIPPRVESR